MNLYASSVYVHVCTFIVSSLTNRKRFLLAQYQQNMKKQIQHREGEERDRQLCDHI